MRAQLSKAQADYASLKSKYDKDIMTKTEEFEDFRRRMNARIAELEDAAESARGRASKLEKDKSRLQIELREVTAEFEAVSSPKQSEKLKTDE